MNTELEEMNISDTLVSFGSEIKVIGETSDAWQVGGWAVIFDTHDASNLKDMFSASTDYDFENGEVRSLYYNHGLDGTIKKTRIGRASLELKDAGVWYSGEVAKRKDYLKAHAEKIVEGIKSGIFGTSTGAPSHLVEREKIAGGHAVKMWPISEISITPTPAEPLTSCMSLKSLVELEEEIGVDELLNDEAKSLGRSFGTHMTQPRDDHGRWTDGAGKLSATHVAAVMAHEGIHESKHGAVLDKIKSGEHKTRADVLAHIDSIHAMNGTDAPSSAPKVSRAYIESIANTAIANKTEGAVSHAKKVKKALADADEHHLELSNDEVTNAVIGLMSKTSHYNEPNGSGRSEVIERVKEYSRANSSLMENRPKSPEKEAHDFAHESKLKAEVEIAQARLDAHNEKAARRRASSLSGRLADEGQYGGSPGRGNRAINRQLAREGSGSFDKHLSEAKENIRLHDELALAKARHERYSNGLTKKNGFRKSVDDDYEWDEREDNNEYSFDEDETPETKHLTALELGQTEGSRFVEHLSRALAANGELHERIEDLVSDRAQNRKSGVGLSAEKHAQISEYRDGLQTIADSLDVLLEAHNPHANANSDATTVDQAQIKAQVEQVLANAEIAAMRAKGVRI